MADRDEAIRARFNEDKHLEILRGYAAGERLLHHHELQPIVGVAADRIARLTVDLAAMTAERDAMRERAEAAERAFSRADEVDFVGTWHPVEENPPKPTAYLVTDKNGGIRISEFARTAEKAYWRGEDGGFYYAHPANHGVIAWAELPEPWRGPVAEKGNEP